MDAGTPCAPLFRFKDFEFDPHAGELRNKRQHVRLGERSLRVLLMLVEHPGKVVTREELRQTIWPGNTFVDFEDGLNHAVKNLREALGDSAEHPRFVETLPRHGYRFIAPVDVGAVREPPLGRRWPILLTAGALVAVVAALVGLNIGSLRGRILRQVGAIHESPLQIRSIAVLPLENLSRDPDQEYFADGMTDALITDLGKIGALRVISRTSVMVYKGKRKTLPEIAKELNVDAVVEGTVQRSVGRVRITAQLLDARNDRHLWAESYERDLREVLSLQGEIARAIAGEVKAKLTPDVATRLTRARPVNPEAFDLYLKGVDWGTRGDRKKALEYFQQAIEKDPNFARAHLGVAEHYRRLGHAVELGAVEAFGRARASARKALELDDSLAEAHIVLGDASWFGDWDWSGAERECRRALEVNPNSEFAHGGYGRCLSLLARHDEAIAEAKRVVEISPARPGSYYWLMEAYIFAGRYDQALDQRQKMLQLDPRADPLEDTAWAYRGKGMYKEAIAAFLSIPGPYASSPPLLAHLGHTYALSGNRAEAEKDIRKLVERTANEGVGAYEVAVVYAGLGENDRALEWLDRAYEMHDKGCAYLKINPPVDPLRSDPRFQALLRRMNFPP